MSKFHVFKIVKLFFKVVAPFYISTTSESEFQLLHILANTWYISLLVFCNSNRCVLVSHWVLICISLITNDVEYLSCFFSICIFCLVKILYPLKKRGYFLTVEFWESFIYPANMSLISIMFCKNFLPICDFSFLSPNSVFWRIVFNFDEVQFITVFF